MALASHRNPGTRPADPRAFGGKGVRIKTPDARELATRVEAIRDHGTTISLFFRGLTGADIPVGSRLAFDD